MRKIIPIRRNKMNKTLDYILGFITGISISIAVYACTNPIMADGQDIMQVEIVNNHEYNPVYVRATQ